MKSLPRALPCQDDNIPALKSRLLTIFLSATVTCTGFFSVRGQAQSAENAGDKNDTQTETNASPKKSDLSLSELPAREDYRFAVGVNVAWQRRQDYGARSAYRFHPGLVFQSYFSLPQNLYLRPGVKLSGIWQQPDMPRSVRIEETDLMGSVDIGVLYNWIVVPALSGGIGGLRRTIKFVKNAPMDPKSDPISQTESHTFEFVQVGVGIPLWGGVALVEPQFRSLWVQGDNRITMEFGLETTIGF